jgi:hypothetical protein
LERDRPNFEKKIIIIHNRNLYSTLNLTFTRWIKWVGYEAGMEAEITCEFLVGYSEGKRHLKSLGAHEMVVLKWILKADWGGSWTALV